MAKHCHLLTQFRLIPSKQICLKINQNYDLKLMADIQVIKHVQEKKHVHALSCLNYSLGSFGTLSAEVL